MLKLDIREGVGWETIRTITLSDKEVQHPEFQLGMQAYRDGHDLTEFDDLTTCNAFALGWWAAIIEAKPEMELMLPYQSEEEIRAAFHPPTVN